MSRTSTGIDGSVVNKMQLAIGHVITESTPFGGAQRNTLLTLDGLMRDGYRPELICGPGGPLIDKAAACGVRVHVLESLIRAVDLVQDYRTLMALYKLFRARRYHIVHTHSTKAGLLGRLAAWWAGVPIIIHTVHGYPFEMDNTLRARAYTTVERWIGHITDALVCVGEAVRQEVAQWRWVPPEKLVTIYSGIDFSSYIPQYTAAETKRRLGLEGSWPIVGSIGHLVEAKAQHYLIEAIALLRKQYPRIRLLLVGGGRLCAALKEQVRCLQLQSHVVLLGERGDIADLLNVFDLYAMSSRYEGVGRALTEAMYWGLPVVATSVNGVKELVIHEETGLLVPPRDPSAIASAIDRLASNPALAQRLGANARLKASALMDSRQMVKALEQLYGRLIGPGPTRASACDHNAYRQDNCAQRPI